VFWGGAFTVSVRKRRKGGIPKHGPSRAKGEVSVFKPDSPRGEKEAGTIYP